MLLEYLLQVNMKLLIFLLLTGVFCLPEEKFLQLRRVLNACNFSDGLLEQYFEIFINEEVDPEMLEEMSHEDLKSLGIKTFGQRFKIRKAIKEMVILNADNESPSIQHNPDPLEQSVAINTENRDDIGTPANSTAGPLATPSRTIDEDEPLFFKMTNNKGKISHHFQIGCYM